MSTAAEFAHWIDTTLQPLAVRVAAGELDFADALGDLVDWARASGRYSLDYPLSDHLADTVACIEADAADDVEDSIIAAASAGVPRDIALEIALASAEGRLPRSTVALIVEATYRA